MINVLTYEKSQYMLNANDVRESRGIYELQINAAIEKFCQQLDYIDQRASEARANHDELFCLTARAIVEMKKSADIFETAAANDKTKILRARMALRNASSRFFSKSFFNRGRTWPQGYPGDHVMIEFLYRNSPQSEGIGYYLDRYFLSTTLTVAVRERKDQLRELVRVEMAKRSGAKILDIACGSCREVFELAADIERTGAFITCVDNDSDALSFAASRLSFLGSVSNNTAFRSYNALKMVNNERNQRVFGPQDIIYSVGFFDYLGDEVLIRLLSALYELLTPHGALIASFKDSQNYSTFDTSWLLDWDAFVQRTEDDMWQLFDKAGIPRESLSTVTERSGVIRFFTARK